MRPPPSGVGGVSVSVLLVLCTAGLLITAASAEQPLSVHFGCDRYTNSAQKSLCLQLSAKLNQQAGGNGAVRLQSEGYSRRGHEQEYPGQREPWYSYGPDGDSNSPYYSQQEEPSAEYEPRGYSKGPYKREGPSPYYSRGSPTPSAPLTPTIETSFKIDVTPKNSSATGRLTQDDFEYWRVKMTRSAALSDGNDTSSNYLSLIQAFECEAPTTFDVVGEISNPASMTVTCNMVPVYEPVYEPGLGQSRGQVEAGAKFDWKQAQQPRSWITVPNPSQLNYSVNVVNTDSDDLNYAYTANVSSMQSPVAFSGSIVDLMFDVLLGQPASYAFNATADNFVLLQEPTDPGKGQPGDAPAPSICDKLTGPAQKICQRHGDKLNTPLQRRAAATLPPALHRAAGGVQVMSRSQAGAAGAAKAGAQTHQQLYGGDYEPYKASNPAVPLVPTTSSDLVITLTAPESVVNATGHLSDAAFSEWDVSLLRRASLQDRRTVFSNNALSNNALSVEQYFKCVSPVDFIFSGPVGAPNSVHVGCQMEASSATIHVGPKFPWMEAPRKKYEIDIAQPQWGRYIRPNSGWLLPLYDATGVVTGIQSKVPFEGSITDLVSEALFGKPSEFAFEATVASLYPSNVF